MNNIWAQKYNEGFEQGRIEAKIELAMESITNPTGVRRSLDEMVTSGVITEFQRQQALFYVQLGLSLPAIIK